MQNERVETKRYLSIEQLDKIAAFGSIGMQLSDAITLATLCDPDVFEKCSISLARTVWQQNVLLLSQKAHQGLVDAAAAGNATACDRLETRARRLLRDPPELAPQSALPIYELGMNSILSGIDAAMAKQRQYREEQERDGEI